jgi:hypothetical protein
MLDIARGSVSRANKASGYTQGVVEVGRADSYSVFQFFIPLNEIFPQLKEFPDDLVYLGLG